MAYRAVNRYLARPGAHRSAVYEYATALRVKAATLTALDVASAQ
ncbi:hypothetical protein SAMN06264364_11784 [Quadrisphaera granulorum]|uniref:Uncharacterized protein n=1 Tax=Quadrisphaera granulorum TaxID=317664 RepID=A0A316A5S3_9ACTN|nr:hypothetical protein [Quadrisphaera granulorum]PWJ52832.1 hypothetical protein BXY45_11784 [Quadrisphaera granulorum]SZE97437.1 hypothetical protein SAMN06264364_11784 [Quadrisphaera granulorum]